jgi:hypothetical protein
LARAAIGHPDPLRDDEAARFSASLYAELAQGGFSLGDSFKRAAHLVSTHSPKLFGDESLRLASLEAGEPLIDDRLPPGNLPSREKFFFGRGRELYDLARNLEQTPLVAVLSGVSGIGKTSLAVEAAHRSAWRFPGGMFFGDGRGAPSAEFLLRGMAAALDLPLQAGQAPEEPLLARARENPSLFLLDNLEGLPPEDLARLAAFLRRLPRGSAALATLRPSAPVFEDLPEARPQPLARGLEIEPAARYALALAAQWNLESLQRPDLALRLARAAGGHPLILEKIIALARKRPLAHMLDSVQSLGGEYLHILQTVMAWSLESLDEPARDALACLPIFAAGSCTPQALAAALGIAPTQLYPRLDLLREAALLVFDPRWERCSWHASVADYARAALHPNDWDGRCGRALEQLCGVFENLPVKEHDSSARPDLLADLISVSLLAEWAGGQPDGTPLARLSTAPSNWWGLLSYHQKWHTWLIDSLSKGIEDKKLRANVLKAIGDVQNFRKEIDAALASYGEALKLFRQVGDRLGEANVLQAIGQMEIQTAANQDQFSKGMSTLQSAFSLFEQVGDRVGQVNILMFLSRLAANQEQFGQAVEIGRNALKLLMDVAGKNHPVTVSFSEFVRQLELKTSSK